MVLRFFLFVLQGFFQFLSGIDPSLDELVEAGKILHPRMYSTFIDKVQDL